MREIPMYSPHPPAKLFQRFVFTQDIKIGSSTALVAELSNYVNYKEFRWAFETSPQFGDTQPIKGLVLESGKIKIETNSVDEIQESDIVLLKSEIWDNAERFFKISEPIRKEYVYTPKARLFRQYLTLELLKADEPNLK